MSSFRRRLMMAKRSLPYVPLEYVQADGHQYFNTRVLFTSDMKIKVSIKFLDEQMSDITGRWLGTKGILLSRMYGSTYGRINNSYNVPSYINTKYDIDFSLDGFVVNGVNLGGYTASDYIALEVDTHSSIGIDESYIHLLTSLNSYNEPVYPYSQDSQGGTVFYYSQIYTGEVLKRDLIPCKDKQGVVCMYDKVTETFFYNQGTGSFTAGPEI